MADQFKIDETTKLIVTVEHIGEQVNKLLEIAQETQISINTIASLQSVEREKRIHNTEAIKDIEEKKIDAVYKFTREEIEKSSNLTSIKIKNWIYVSILGGFSIVIMLFLKDFLIKLFI